MRKFLLLTVLILSCIGLNACTNVSGQNETIEYEPGTLTISFDYEKQSGFSSNQFAIWIEDMEGNYINTLYATRFTANGGFEKRPDSLLTWVDKSDLANMSNVDAITSATPKAGTLAYVWDLTDADNVAVSPGEYRFFVEGSLRGRNRVVFSNVVDISGGLVSAASESMFFYEESGNIAALTDEAKENGMIRNVNARFMP